MKIIWKRLVFSKKSLYLCTVRKKIRKNTLFLDKFEINIYLYIKEKLINKVNLNENERKIVLCISRLC